VRFHYDLTEASEAYDAGTNFDFVAHSEIQRMGSRKYIFLPASSVFFEPVHWSCMTIGYVYRMYFLIITCEMYPPTV
jgi:hypothetical protein